MAPEIQHRERVERIEEEMKDHLAMKNSLGHPLCLSLRYNRAPSNTTREKAYKAEGSARLDLSPLNHIVRVNTEKQTVVVEPRVTMEELVAATLPFGLIVPIVPEFKGITVGGALLGGATESSGHKWGLFHDLALSYEVMIGNGQVLQASPYENQDLFYALPCSYGALGVLLSVELKLVPAFEKVSLAYTVFTKPSDALQFLCQRAHAWDAPDFLDGIVFSPTLSVVIEGMGHMHQEPLFPPLFSMKRPGSEWYYQHVRRKATESKSVSFEESMTLVDYLFRYDRGAFWMGSYLFSSRFARMFLIEALLHRKREKAHVFDLADRCTIGELKGPNAFWRAVLSPLLTSKQLWTLFHRAERWMHNQLLIQDFCIPEESVLYFLEEAIEEARVFPLWLCPIKGTRENQLFAPHLLSGKGEETHVINVGMYGIPTVDKDVPQLTRSLEKKTHMYGGRKVLYSRSYYTKEEFWHIYPHGAYESLREKTHAHGIWHDILDKVLSE